MIRKCYTCLWSLYNIRKDSLLDQLPWLTGDSYTSTARNNIRSRASYHKEDQNSAALTEPHWWIYAILAQDAIHTSQPTGTRRKLDSRSKLPLLRNSGTRVGVPMILLCLGTCSGKVGCKRFGDRPRSANIAGKGVAESPCDLIPLPSRIVKSDQVNPYCLVLIHVG